MRRGEHPLDRVNSRVTPAVPTAGDRIFRQAVRWALPTGVLALAAEPHRGQLRELFASVHAVTAGVQRVLRCLAGKYLAQRRQAEARVQQGDWEGLFEFIGDDPHRLGDEWVQGTLGRWLAHQIHARDFASAVTKLRKLAKRVHPRHEADLRQVFAGVGKGYYDGYSNKYMFTHGRHWDPILKVWGRTARADDTLKERFLQGRRYYWPQTLSLSFQRLARVSGPTRSIANVW